MKRVVAMIVAATLGALAGTGWAQQQDKPAAPVQVAQATASPATQPAPGGVRGQSIFDVRPDAAADPDYAKQSNAERNQVQPGNNAPMWRQVNSGTAGYSSLPYAESGVLIQGFTQYPFSRLTNAGEAWRQVRNRVILPYGGAFLLIVLVAVALFHLRTGGIKMNAPRTGRMVERFTAFERSAHMLNATAFVLLALSGIVMAFGKFFLQPVIGSTLFGWLTYALKTLHNFVGPLFTVSLVVVILTFLKDNFPTQGDLQWVLKGGGMWSEHEIPSHRFNGGEKLVYWAGVFVLGLTVVGSGLVLDQLVPGVVYDRSTMQIANMIHGVATVLMMAMFLGHAYLGTLGTEGAMDGMRTGYVDEAWARQHHELWLKDIDDGKIPATRGSERAPARPAQA
jgi:formate dehydrogenase subunit gamma